MRKRPGRIDPLTRLKLLYGRFEVNICGNLELEVGLMAYCVEGDTGAKKIFESKIPGPAHSLA